MADLLANVDFTGSDGAALPAVFVASAVFNGGTGTIQSNRGRLGTGTAGGYASSDKQAYRIDIGSVTDCEVLVSFTIDATECYPFFHVRSASAEIDEATTYRLRLGRDHLILEKVIAFSYTALGEGPTGQITEGVQYTLRFRAVGSSLQARMWAAGGTEPSSWQIDVTDASITSGYLGVEAAGGAAASATYVYFDNLAITDGTTTTPDAGSGTIVGSPYVGKQETTFASAGTSFPFTTPSAALAGDVLVAYFAYNPPTAVDVANTLPAGWTAVGAGAFDSGASNGSSHLQVATTTAAGGVETHTWTTASSVASGVISVTAYRGINTTTPFETSSYGTEATSVTAHATPTATPAASGEWLVAAWAGRLNEAFTLGTGGLTLVRRTPALSANGAAPGAQGTRLEVDDSAANVSVASTGYTFSSVEAAGSGVVTSFVGALQVSPTAGSTTLWTRFPDTGTYVTSKYQSLIISVRVHEPVAADAPTKFGTLFVYHFDSNAALIDEQLVRFTGDNANAWDSGYLSYPLIQVPCIGTQMVAYVIFDEPGLTGQISITGSYRQIPTPRVFSGGAYFGSSGNGYALGGGVDGWAGWFGNVPGGATWTEYPYCWSGPALFTIDITDAIPSPGIDVLLSDGVTNFTLAGKRGIITTGPDYLTFPVNIPCGPMQFRIVNRTTATTPQVACAIQSQTSQ